MKFKLKHYDSRGRKYITRLLAALKAAKKAGDQAQVTMLRQQIDRVKR